MTKNCTCPRRYATTQTPLGDDMHTPNCAVNATYDITRDEISEECDGMFLLWDTAAHIDSRPTDADVREHIVWCEKCSEINAGI